MSVQWSVALRNRLLDAIATEIGATPHIEIWTGAQPATCATASSGTKLAKFDLAGAVGAWDDAAASGAKNMVAAATLPLSTTGLAAGSAGYYRFFKSDDSTCVEQGSITATGGGGDMTIDNVTIAVAQAVQLTGYVKTAPGV